MGWYEAVKDAVSMAQKADNIPMYKGLIDAQKEILDLIQKNSDLQKKVDGLQKQIELSKEVVIEDNICYRIENDIKVLYCLTCFDKNKALIHLHNPDSDRYCPICRRSYSSNLLEPTKIKDVYNPFD